MPSCIRQIGCGSRGDSRETHRIRAGYSPGINAWLRRYLSPSSPCRSWRSLFQARTVFAIDMALLTDLSRGRVSAFRFPGCLIRDVDATGSGMARSRRRVSCLWTGQERFYGTRACLGWYQGRSSEVPVESRRRWLFRLLQMLMLPQRAFGRAIVRASPVFERWA
jgi:hypothetical protein